MLQLVRGSQFPHHPRQLRKETGCGCWCGGTASVSMHSRGWSGVSLCYGEMWYDGAGESIMHRLTKPPLEWQRRNTSPEWVRNLTAEKYNCLLQEEVIFSAQSIWKITASCVRPVFVSVAPMIIPMHHPPFAKHLFTDHKVYKKTAPQLACDFTLMVWCREGFQIACEWWKLFHTYGFSR